MTGRIERQWVLLALLVLTGCASRAPLLTPLLSESGLQQELELRDTPFFPQRQYQCGPAALATLLHHSGVPTTPDELVPLVYLPGKEGSLQLEMIAASRRFNRIPYLIDPALPALFAELQGGRPVLVFQNLGLKSYPLWHYAVVIGYSQEQDRVLLRSGITRRETLSARRFLRSWELGGRWAMVLLKPGELPVGADRVRYLKAVASTEQVAEPGALLAAYRAALVRWPGDPLAGFGLAASLHSSGDLEAAESAYRQLLKQQPDHAAALNNLAEVLADRGCFRAATATIDRALDADSGGLRQALLATRREIGQRQRQAGSDGSCQPADSLQN